MSKHHKQSPAFILVLGAALMVAVIAKAASPVFWNVSTQAELLNGEVENLSIDASGRLVLGPVNELIHETTSPILWTVMRGWDGALYMGSGNEGRVYRVDRTGKASVFFDSPELVVHALADAPGGGLLVGTSPDGRIYKVDQTGNSKVFFEPGEKYIWALATGPDGSLYAATGEKGTIYQIQPDGTGKPFYRTTSTHVVSLTFDAAGRLIAGTDSPGKVFRVEKDGRGFVLLDSPYREIRALQRDKDGNIYAAALNPGGTQPDERAAPKPSVETTAQPVATVSTEITAISIADLSVTAVPDVRQARREEQRTSRGAVYRITPEGFWDLVWESPEDVPYDLAIEQDGAVIIGTGSKGKIHRVSGDPPRSMLVTRAVAQQVTRFLRDAEGRLYYTTANAGKLFRLSADRAEQGVYESQVRDAGTVASWGTISWRASAPGKSEVQLFTRSGNTGVPDETWSPWSRAYTNPDGVQIESPNARYLQWKAVLKGNSRDQPVLTSVRAAYLPRNLRPRVTSVTVHPPGIVFQKPFSTGEMEIAGADGTGIDLKPPTSALGADTPVALTAGPALGRRIYQKGLRTFAWRAQDDNDDRLQYDLLYRREGETEWKVLKRELDDTIFVWDTTSVPDGSYVVNVVASDAPSHPAGSALSGEMESIAFDIDNTPPVIDIRAVRREGARTVIAFDVRDEHSTIERVEYSVDARPWRPLYPTDGMADSRMEQYELVLTGDEATRSVVIRAVDAMNNAASVKATEPARTTLR
jgi:YD repeat-containing protein